MVILSNFPMVSQRTNITPYAGPSINGSMDCVPASIGAAILWYQGKRQWDTEIDPEALKEAAYNEYYTGGTAAAAYVAICEKLGYKLYAVNTASNVAAVAEAHKLIKSGKPVIFTQVDDYSTNPDYSHVSVFFAEGAGNLTCLDPYIAQPLQKSDATWASRLLSTQLWTIEPMEVTLMLQLTDPMGRFFEAKDANRWHCINTNVDLAYDHLSFYRRYEGVFGLPLTNEIYLSALPGTAIVVYERGIAIYDPEPRKAEAGPPGAGTTYLMHIDSGIGQQIIAKPLVQELQAQIIKLNAEIDDAPAAAELASLKTKLAAYEAAFATISTAIATEGKA